MRVIALGCEYTGVTTLINGLRDWGRARGIHHHLDDHFTIPDAYHLSQEEQQAMLGLLPILKERFQRMQIVYHIRLLHRYEHILLGGFHLEEEVYGPLYYYPGIQVQETHQYETEMPPDTLLVHLHARPEVIRARLEKTPHPHTLIKKEDIPRLLELFRQQYQHSWLKHKFEIDTSDLKPDQLLQTFLDQSIPHLNTRDMLLRMNERLSGQP